MTHRLLHLADLHLDRAFAGVGCLGELARRRRQGLRDSLRRAGEEARVSGCATITIGGDLYEHERADLETGRFLAETFASWAPMRVVIAPGNHDPLLPGSLWTRTEWPGNVHIFEETALAPLALEDGLTLWGMAHREHAYAGDPLAIPRVGGDGGVHLALFHGAELGSRPEGKSLHGPFHAEHIAERGFAAALCGHYHRRRVDPEMRLLYPGTPEPLAFDEEGQRGPVRVDVGADGSVRYHPLALNAWTAITADCALDGATSFGAVLDRTGATAHEALGSGEGCRTMLRLHLLGEVPPEIGIDIPTVELTIRDALGLAVVRARDLTTPAIDLGAALADPTARGLFTREVLGAIDRAGEDAEEQAVLTDALRYGLQALGGVEVGLR